MTAGCLWRQASAVEGSEASGRPKRSREAARLREARPEAFHGAGSSGNEFSAAASFERLCACEGLPLSFARCLCHNKPFFAVLLLANPSVGVGHVSCLPFEPGRLPWARWAGALRSLPCSLRGINAPRSQPAYRVVGRGLGQFQHALLSQGCCIQKPEPLFGQGPEPGVGRLPRPGLA